MVDIKLLKLNRFVNENNNRFFFDIIAKSRQMMNKIQDYHPMTLIMNQRGLLH